MKVRRHISHGFGKEIFSKCAFESTDDHTEAQIWSHNQRVPLSV
jgi:hypothetical protein